MNRNRREDKYDLKFIAISNGLEFPLNGRSNNYLHAEVIGTLTELFVDSLWDILSSGTMIQQRLEWAWIFQDTCKAFIYLSPSTAEQYTADKHCQVGKKRANINSYTYAQSRHDGHRKANAGPLRAIISPVQVTPWLTLRTASNDEWSYSG